MMAAGRGLFHRKDQRQFGSWPTFSKNMQEEFAKLESENTGKPYKFVSLGADLMFSIDNLRFFAGAARDTHGSHAGEYWPGYTSMYRRDPVGVVGQIAPWNYPLMMAVWKIGPALAAGCTTVFKPASLTPLTSLMLADIIKEAGIPDGVVNIITGRKAGQWLVEHPDIRMISVTGSTEVGQTIMKTAANTIKRVHLELGGKAPVLVFDDADVDLVAESCFGGNHQHRLRHPVRRSCRRRRTGRS